MSLLGDGVLDDDVRINEYIFKNRSNEHNTQHPKIAYSCIRKQDPTCLLSYCTEHHATTSILCTNLFCINMYININSIIHVSKILCLYITIIRHSIIVQKVELYIILKKSIPRSLLFITVFF